MPGAVVSLACFGVFSNLKNSTEPQTNKHHTSNFKCSGIVLCRSQITVKSEETQTVRSISEFKYEAQTALFKDPVRTAQ